MPLSHQSPMFDWTSAKLLQLITFGSTFWTVTLFLVAVCPLNLPVHLFWAVCSLCATSTDSNSAVVKRWPAKPEKKNPTKKTQTFWLETIYTVAVWNGSNTASVSVPLSEHQRVPSEGKLSRCWPRTLGRGFLLVRHPTILAKPCSGAVMPSTITIHKGWSMLWFMFYCDDDSFPPGLNSIL